MIKNFSCFKVKEKKEGQPDYNLSAKIGDKYENIGAGWIKEKEGGEKYISFSLRKPYNEMKGLMIVEEELPSVTIAKLHEVADEERKNLDDIPF